MVFTKRLREGVRRGRIRCSVRIWTRPHVKVGGRYPMDDGHIVDDLLAIARHGKGDQIYLIRFHYLPPGAWDAPRWGGQH